MTTNFNSLCKADLVQQVRFLRHPEFTALLVADNRRLTREGARRVFQGLTNWRRKLQVGKMLKPS